jgi:hypothetical protein
MADDEPAGMFDTTRTISAAEIAAAVSQSASDHGDASSVSSVPVGAEPVVAAGDSSVSASAAPSGIDALIAARAHPAGLPPEARAAKSTNSKDAAAEALKKFFGKR